MSSSHQPARRGQQQLDARFSPDGGRVGRFALFLFPYVCGTVLERAPITKWTDEVGTIGRRRQQRLYFLLFLSLFIVTLAQHMKQRMTDAISASDTLKNNIGQDLIIPSEATDPLESGYRYNFEKDCKNYKKDGFVARVVRNSKKTDADLQ
jgi:hypothetical protein